MIRHFAIVSVAALALAGCSSSSSYFVDAKDETQTERRTTLFGAMLTMTGVIPPEGNEIAYQPRSPLAMPAQPNLPAPESGAAADAAVNFPQDHDEAERQRRAALRELGDSVRGDPNDWDDAGILTPAEAAQFRREGGGQRQRRNFGGFIESMRTENRVGAQTRREIEIGKKMRRKSDAVLTAEGQATPRRYLIQPPDEYRAPSQTADVPERGDIEHSKWLRDQLYRNSHQNLSVFDR